MGALCLALVAPHAAQAQGTDEGPLLEFGVTTGAVFNSNRGLDDDNPGSTTEFNTQLDVLLRLATPIQQLEFSGDVTLRTVSGADSASLPSGFVNPNLALSYGRAARDARLDLDLFYSEADVSSSDLQFDPETASFSLLEDTGTQRRFGFDTALELRRRSPFGVTFSAGYSGLRYSDTSDPDLTAQDRFRLGARFRFDLTPATQAIVDAQFSTFEDEGTAEGRRDTISLNTSLRQELRNGDVIFRFDTTDTEDGTRYTLSAGRTIETALWELSGVFGLTRELSGDVVPSGEVDVTRALPNGELSASLAHVIRSDSDDDEQEVTTFSFGYVTQLTPLASLNTNLSYSDRSATGAGESGTFGTFGVNFQYNLTQDWSMNVGVQHRFSEDDVGAKARDNSLTIGFRRAFQARR